MFLLLAVVFALVVQWEGHVVPDFYYKICCFERKKLKMLDFWRFSKVCFWTLLWRDKASLSFVFLLTPGCANHQLVIL